VRGGRRRLCGEREGKKKKALLSGRAAHRTPPHSRTSHAKLSSSGAGGAAPSSATAANADSLARLEDAPGATGEGRASSRRRLLASKPDAPARWTAADAHSTSFMTAFMRLSASLSITLLFSLARRHPCSRSVNLLWCQTAGGKIFSRFGPGRALFAPYHRKLAERTTPRSAERTPLEKRPTPPARPARKNGKGSLPPLTPRARGGVHSKLFRAGPRPTKTHFESLVRVLCLAIG
jgi:hypothetical protein